MRWIDKSGLPPRALEEYLNNQRPIGVNLDYESFTRKRELRQELVAHQRGLCAFTGAAIDDRLGSISPDGHLTSPSGAKLNIKVHNAHLKPQSVCKQEMIARNEEPGRSLGEDMDHRNIVAALLMEGAKEETFGAAAQINRLLLISPIEPDCEARFHFAGNGQVQGIGPEASDTVAILKLCHRTLEGWRREAIEAFIDPAKITSISDLEAIIAAMNTSSNGRLPAYCFAIKQVAERLIL
ncbi:MAG: hypothetical protein WCT12_23795 [Verrucomicrobiota bacterium]